LLFSYPWIHVNLLKFAKYVHDTEPEKHTKEHISPTMAEQSQNGDSAGTSGHGMAVNLKKYSPS